MRRELGTALVIGATVLAAASLGGRPADAAPSRDHASSLMNLTARSAALARNARGGHTLVLTGVSGSVARQSDRPSRPRSGEMTVEDLTSSWTSWVSRAGARALVVQSGAGAGRRARLMRVGRPTWNRDRRELSLPASPLRGSFGGLGALGAKNATFRPGAIGPATVTIETTRGRIIDGCWLGPGARCVGRDLSGAGLAGARLRGVVMPIGKLERTRLGRADLRDAILPRALGRGLRAPGAKLNGAILASSDLRDAVLVGADLTDAVLAASDLRGANLRGAKADGLVLDRTRQCRTILPDGRRSDRDCDSADANAPAAAAAATRPKPQFLFVLAGQRGRVSRTPGGYRLELRGAQAEVARFSDRPDRLADTTALTTFVREWATNGFVSDPPNAALVVPGGPRGRGVMVLELRRPRVTGGTISFLARPVGKPTGGLAPFARRADRARAQTFGPASLFVDGAPGNVSYQPLTIRFLNAQPGQRVVVTAQGNGADVAFSAGPQGESTSGIQLTSSGGGAVPVSQFSVTASRLSLTMSPTATGVPSINGSIGTYLLAGPGLSTFALRAASAPGVVMTAQLGNGAPQSVNVGQTLFPWRPI